MSTPEHFLARLLELPRLADPEVRRGVFRQTVATLGHGEAAGAPMALAGVDPRAFAHSIEVAHADGLFDDLGFVGAAAVASALHQIASALPLGPERRSIGRKVLTYLYKGDAETFAALAARMALASIKPLEGAGVRARVELCLALHGPTDPATDRLALAVTMRRELALDWICHAATSSLPDRRFAAQLLERAAREAARRASRGDRHPLQVFDEVTAGPSSASRPGAEGIGRAWNGLLADRESLVWRHVAAARGLLAASSPNVVAQVRALLAPELSPTEWRRGATSLVASIAVDRERALDESLALLDGPLLRRDPGIAMAMVWGLAPAAEVEPEAAEELLDALAMLVPVAIAESIVELRQRVPGFGDAAAQKCAAALRASLGATLLDDGVAALATGVAHALDAEGRPRGLAAEIQSALDAFAERGAPEALALAHRALATASEELAALTSIEVSYDAAPGAALARQRAMLPLATLDATLLESHVLGSLLLLEKAPGAEGTGVPALDDLHGRLASWLLDPRRRDASPAEADAQATLHQRQLRTLLHLIDAGHTDFGDDQERRAAIRARWTSVVAVYTAFLRKEPQTRLTRGLLATVARALDALVRDGSAEPVDVALFVAATLPDPGHIAIVAEASMHPDVTRLVGGYLAFVRAEHAGPSVEQAASRCKAFTAFLETFPIQTTLRTEALRTTAWTLVRALEAVVAANSLRALSAEATGADLGPLEVLEDAVLQLQQLVVGAERRAAELVTRSRVAVAQPHALAQALDAALHAGNEAELASALTMTSRFAEAALPGPIAALVGQCLGHVASLQADRASLPPMPLPTREAPLPDWLPARRVLGGFYVVRQLGGGNVGSVFVVTRADERRNKDAPRFALKVPDYDSTAARTMSEADFLRLFREEAGALLAIPEHPNIASFVTFDAGAKPKPLLVMELVEGLSCERLLGAHNFSIPLVLHVLEGMLAGLAAMHDVGIAHLDVKPSNVILRAKTGDPVLVDFGLAGRKVRAGCATLCYGAPEIWEATPETVRLLPAAAADVYAFGACAFEFLTMRTLFDGPSDVAIITQHMTHDGLPPGVANLGSSHPHLRDFVSWCLRRNPQARGSVKQLRAMLPQVRKELEGASWPLA